MLLMAPLALAQVVGEQAELDRLRARVEEAIANEDPDAASMAAGKAALMAAELARRHGDSDESRSYRALEAVLRAQEHGYRALALFTRAGGQPPASSGVCGSLSQAYHELARSTTLTNGATGSSGVPGAIAQWTATLDDLRNDFQCR